MVDIDDRQQMKETDDSQHQGYGISSPQVSKKQKPKQIINLLCHLLGQKRCHLFGIPLVLSPQILTLLIADLKTSLASSDFLL